mgnify:FL=1
MPGSFANSTNSVFQLNCGRTTLPDEFDRQTFIDISSRLGMPLSTAERNIKKWTDEGLLIRQDLGHYKKVGK